MANLVHADGVGIECRKEKHEKSLEPELESLLVVEAESAQKGGRVDGRLQGELTLENIMSNEPKLKLAEATKSDDFLATARFLADSQSEGYHWQDGRGGGGGGGGGLLVPTDIGQGHCTRNFCFFSSIQNRIFLGT